MVKKAKVAPISCVFSTPCCFCLQWAMRKYKNVLASDGKLIYMESNENRLSVSIILMYGIEIGCMDIKTVVLKVYISLKFIP
jgi:hypothetical protein